MTDNIIDFPSSEEMVMVSDIVTITINIQPVHLQPKPQSIVSKFNAPECHCVPPFAQFCCFLEWPEAANTELS